MPRIFLIRFAVLVLLTLSVASGCEGQETLQKLASAEEQALAQQYVEYLRKRDVDEIVKVADPSIQSATLRNTLLTMADLMPAEPALSTKLVGVQRQAFVNQDQTTLNLTFEYEYANKWILANIATKKTSTSCTIVGMHVTPQANSLESLNAFRLSGKTPVHYITLLLACAFTLLTLYALVVCTRTKMLRCKWLWIPFILFGIGRFAINWTTGEWYVIPFAVQLLSAMATAPLNGPWMIAVSFPLGPIVFLALRKRLCHA